MPRRKSQSPTSRRLKDRVVKKSPVRSPKRTPMGEHEFYCLRRRSVIQVSPEMIHYQEDKAGRPRLVAYDGHYMYKYVKKVDVPRLKQMYPRL